MRNVLIPHVRNWQMTLVMIDRCFFQILVNVIDLPVVVQSSKSQCSSFETNALSTVPRKNSKFSQKLISMTNSTGFLLSSYRPVRAQSAWLWLLAESRLYHLTLVVETIHYSDCTIIFVQIIRFNHF